MPKFELNANKTLFSLSLNCGNVAVFFCVI